MVQIFSNREIALSIWLFVFLFWCFTQQEVRDSIKGVLLAFCHRSILTIFGLMAGYIYLAVGFLSSAGLWDFDQLKSTLMWFFFVASVELFRANSIGEEKGYFVKSIKNHFKFLVVLEFIVAFQSFSLAAELIIVLISTLVMFIMVVAESKEEHVLVAKIMSRILSSFGIVMVCFGLYFIILKFGEFAQLKTFMNFTTPIALSILLLPFIFVISVYIRYERILVRVNIYTEDRFYRIYVKFKGIVHFKNNYKSLNDWLSFSCISDFESRRSINNSIVKFNKNRADIV